MERKVDRSTTVPFHLKLFYRSGSHIRLDELPTHPDSALPSHLQIYTWPNCSLRELSHLLVSSLPDVLPNPSVGTRLAFRLIFPEPTSLRSQANGPGRYTSKELGSVVVGGDGAHRLPDQEEHDRVVSNGIMSGKLDGEPDKTLQDARFVIGDYVSCAILPPGRDGEVQGPLGGRMRAFPIDSRANGHSRESGRRGGYGSRDGNYSRLAESKVPSGEWRRGEKIPDFSPRGYGRGQHRRGY